MSEARKAEVIDIGWELMKYMKAPTIALWLAEDGWEGGVTVVASREDLEPPNVLVSLKCWNELTITADRNPN